ncbi:MAG TPA: beta-ketoacyl reductase, partial [Pseudonocardiaceae bacterium]|nr:beta-ketoacyl reductase [Pseudonocardiaceae bacterium]
TYAEIVDAKVTGALLLDELLAERKLDAFVLFSSGAGVWGNGKQSPYAAANAYLDAIARRRRDQGRSALAVAWGRWAGEGMVDPATADLHRQRGVPAMDPALALTALQQALDHDENTLVVADIDWERFVPAYTFARTRPLLRALPEAQRVLLGDGQTSDTTDEDALAARLARMSDVDRERVLLDLVRTQAASVLGHPNPDEVRPGRQFRELGFDSLTAVEFRNRLNRVTGLRLPATLVFDYPTPAVLAGRLCDELVPDEVDDPLSVELARLEAALADVSSDGDVRGKVAARLRGLLWKWEDSAPDTGGAVLDSATDDEMFDLIDRELGIS